MKLRSVFLICSFGVSVICNAQLTVSSNGTVSTKKINATHQETAIYANRTGFNSLSDGYAIQARSNIDSIMASYGIVGTSTSYSQADATPAKRSYGVMGNAGYGYLGWNFGVFGRLLHGYGAGIYGTSNPSDQGQSLPDSYAGYFNGNVHVAGTLSSDILLSPSSVSEMQVAMMANGQENESVLDKLSGMSAVAYYKEQPVETMVLQEEEVLDVVQAQNLSKKHYALCAEQLEEVYPDLVYTQRDGTKHINYIEMIPLLVQSLNELSAELATLRGENMLYSSKKETTSVSRLSGEDISVLGQNNPNPWNVTTDIKLTIAPQVTNAMFYVYDLTGKQIYEKSITERGVHTIKLTSADFTPGMYVFSLITDGKVVETKRMIVTK